MSTDNNTEHAADPAPPPGKQTGDTVARYTQVDIESAKRGLVKQLQERDAKLAEYEADEARRKQEAEDAERGRLEEEGKHKEIAATFESRAKAAESERDSWRDSHKDIAGHAEEMFKEMYGPHLDKMTEAERDAFMKKPLGHRREILREAARFAGSDSVVVDVSGGGGRGRATITGDSNKADTARKKGRDFVFGGGR